MSITKLQRAIEKTYLIQKVPVTPACVKAKIIENNEMHRPVTAGHRGVWRMPHREKMSPSRASKRQMMGITANGTVADSEIAKPAIPSPFLDWGVLIDLLSISPVSAGLDYPADQFGDQPGQHRSDENPKHHSNYPIYHGILFAPYNLVTTCRNSQFPLACAKWSSMWQLSLVFSSSLLIPPCFAAN